MHAWPRPFIACFALVLGACGGGDTEPAPAEAVVDPPALGLDLVLRPEAERETRLAAVSSWMYQLGGFESADAIATLDREPYEMVVVEPGHNIRSCAPFEPSDVGVPAELHDTACGDGYDYQMLVDELGSAPSGERRLVLAYIDVGQAEWYRDYWTAGWRPPTSRRRGSPSFILSADPDGWTGNFVVSYWDPRWRALWIGDDEHPGLVRELAALGYDGVYLDWIEAYSDETVIEAAESDGVDPADEMVAFVEAIRSAGRSVTPDFLVVAQNAPYLIWETDDSARYADTIDAFAAEDTWSFGNGSTEDWDAGDGDDGPYDISDRLECEAEACRNSINAPDNVCGQPD
ncbi:MAG: cysteinyl-tRNA synthetase, partial [Bradymonadia bacterium]